MWRMSRNDPYVEVDDWEKEATNWFKVKLCHCHYSTTEIATEFCPKCGCTDGWKTSLKRTVWEESKSRLLYSWSHPKGRIAYQRNQVVETWTPESCSDRVVHGMGVKG